jgi:hypothetical protein
MDLCLQSTVKPNVELSYTYVHLGLSFRRAQHFALALVVKLVG